MFFELSKLLNICFSPITWIIALLILSFLLKKKILKRICLSGSIGLFVLSTNTRLVDYVKYCTVKEYTCTRLDTTRHYKTGIVMGGFATMNKETGQMKYEQDRADRLWEAIRLWKQGYIENILITGDPTSVIDDDGNSTAELFLKYMEQLGICRDAFILEQQARNTRENALYTIKILKEKGIADKECLLITSATHIKRSVKCFAKEGVRPDIYTVNTYDPPGKIGHRDFYPDWRAAVEWQELLNEWIGDIAYKIAGYQ